MTPRLGRRNRLPRILSLRQFSIDAAPQSRQSIGQIRRAVPRRKLPGMWPRPSCGVWLILTWLSVALVGTACQPAAPPPPTAVESPAAPRALAPTAQDESAAVSEPPEIAIPWLIFAERAAANRGELTRLAMLWAEESRVFDRRGHEDARHHYVWQGKDAVLNRYVVAVFPHAPPLLADDALDELAIDAAFEPTRRVENLQEGDIVRAVNNDDRWQFIWQEGRWYILELSYTSQ
jgi:hypothetical protein